MVVFYLFIFYIKGVVVSMAGNARGGRVRLLGAPTADHLNPDGTRRWHSKGAYMWAHETYLCLLSPGMGHVCSLCDKVHALSVQGLNYPCNRALL